MMLIKLDILIPRFMQKPGPVTKLILLTIALAVVIGSAFDHYRRANARAEADRIISGQQEVPIWRIHKTITTLVATKSWTASGTKQDYRRVVQLHRIRDKMARAIEKKIFAQDTSWSVEWPSSCQLYSDPNLVSCLQSLEDYAKKSSGKSR